MRKTYPGCEVAKRHRIIYSVYMSKENQADMIRRITRDTFEAYLHVNLNQYVIHLTLREFLQRLNDKFVFTERNDDGVRIQQITDERGTFCYHIEGDMINFSPGCRDTICINVFSTGAEPEALCTVIEKTYPGSKVYYITNDLDGSGYRTNDKDGSIFMALPYSYGYFKSGHNRGETSDDIEDACELMSEIGFRGEHTEQALLEFVEQFPIREEGDYIWFNKLEVVK